MRDLMINTRYKVMRPLVWEVIRSEKMRIDIAGVYPELRLQEQREIKRVVRVKNGNRTDKKMSVVVNGVQHVRAAPPRRQAIVRKV